MTRARPFALAVVSAVVGAATLAARVDPALTLDLQDFAIAPITGSFNGGTGNPGSAARINFMRPEPGGSGRFLLVDLNGPLYFLDAQGKAFTYLDFNGRGSAPGLFDRLPIEAGFANGLIGVQFDPDYVNNGKFYTLHLEEVGVEGALVPDKTNVPGLDLTGYTPTSAVATPGPFIRESVIIEWTDTNIRDTAFQGTAREILRIRLNTRIHPTADMVFNPSARPGDPEWRVMYIAASDGGSGEQTDVAVRQNPQRLDTLVGKILRIIPDPGEHIGTSTTSENGRYRVPNDNPFVKTARARPEIWALGLRNPHRLTWVVDARRPGNSRLVAATVGLHTWETVNIIHKGANFGYSEREGNEALLTSNQTGPRPPVDRLPLLVGDRTWASGSLPVTYPVLQYNHAGAGFAIMGGFVYEGSRLPALRGKFLFGDILTGRLWYANWSEMVAADDGKPDTMAAMHEVNVRWNDPSDVPDAGPRVYPTMNPVVTAAYDARRKATDPAATAPRPARADIRFGFDARGEVFILSKVDGMIRSVVGATFQ